VGNLEDLVTSKRKAGKPVKDMLDVASQTSFIEKTSLYSPKLMIWQIAWAPIIALNAWFENKNTKPIRRVTIEGNVIDQTGKPVLGEIAVSLFKTVSHYHQFAFFLRLA
jgi:hypothetical protein